MRPAGYRLHSGGGGASGPQTSWERLNQILTNVGDLAYRRRILSIAEYLEPRPEHIILDLGAGEGFVQMALRDAFGCRVAALDADAAILHQGLARGTEASGTGLTLRRWPAIAVSRRDLRRRCLLGSAGACA